MGSLLPISVTPNWKTSDKTVHPPTEKRPPAQEPSPNLRVTQEHSQNERRAQLRAFALPWGLYPGLARANGVTEATSGPAAWSIPEQTCLEADLRLSLAHPPSGPGRQRA
jgi:hypothetical protein